MKSRERSWTYLWKRERPSSKEERYSKVAVPSDLGGLNGAHLVDPALSRLDLADGAQLIRRITRDALVEGALQHELDITDLQNFRAASLGHGAGAMEQAVNEGIGKIQNQLRAQSQWVSSE